MTNSPRRLPYVAKGKLEDALALLDEAEDLIKELKSAIQRQNHHKAPFMAAEVELRIVRAKILIAETPVESLAALQDDEEEEG